MRFGVHASVSGGLLRAAERAVERGCQTIQIFTGNPRAWKARELTEKEAREFRESCGHAGLRPVVAHTPYLINLASDDAGVWRRSAEALAEALKRSRLVGCDYLVTHVGSHGGAGEIKGMRRVVRAVNQALEREDGVSLLLENSAGSGSSLGYLLEQLGEIVSNLESTERVGICIDTCHAFAAGYDFTNEENLSRILALFDSIVGQDRLKLIHANDSKAPLGSRRDRHQELGKGFIGKEGFRLIVNHPRLEDLPCILETPSMRLEDDLRNLAFLRSLVTARAND